MKKALILVVVLAVSACSNLRLNCHVDYVETGAEASQ